MTDPRVRDLVSGWLGPAGPEVSCDDCFALLDQYVDLELSGADADDALPGVSAHFDGCPACREDHESLRAFVASHEAA